MRDRFFPGRSKLRDHLVHDHKSDVVSCCSVLRAGISETGDESDALEVLNTLHRRRLVMRTDEGYIAVGGIGIQHD